MKELENNDDYIQLLKEKEIVEKVIETLVVEFSHIKDDDFCAIRFVEEKLIIAFKMQKDINYNFQLLHSNIAIKNMLNTIEDSIRVNNFTKSIRDIESNIDTCYAYNNITSIEHVLENIYKEAENNLESFKNLMTTKLALIGINKGA